jgi:hypothetical protein
VPLSGLEQTAKSMENQRFPQQLGAKSGALPGSEPEKLDVDVLGAALRDLSPADRAKLAAMLTGTSEANSKAK